MCNMVGWFQLMSILTGICMEALCSPRSSEPIESVLTCLQALYTLLDSAWPREILMGDRSLGIELCNVLHRQVLIFISKNLSTYQNNKVIWLRNFAKVKRRHVWSCALFMCKSSTQILLKINQVRVIVSTCFLHKLKEIKT